MSERVLDSAEQGTRKAGLVLAVITLAVLLWGVWRGTRRPVGMRTGREPELMRMPSFYLLASTGYLALCYRLWRPLPLVVRSRPGRVLALFLGGLLYFPGLALVLWGRLALAQMYNVSSSLGVQLYAGHRLVTFGPFALVRHPMYLGIMSASLGGILLYRTWTFVFLLLNFPALVIRARREEAALALAFGSHWVVYCRQVPAWWPRFRRAQYIEGL